MFDDISKYTLEQILWYIENSNIEDQLYGNCILKNPHIAIPIINFPCTDIEKIINLNCLKEKRIIFLSLDEQTTTPSVLEAIINFLKLHKFSFNKLDKTLEAYPERNWSVAIYTLFEINLDE